MSTTASASCFGCVPAYVLVELFGDTAKATEVLRNLADLLDDLDEAPVTSRTSQHKATRGGQGRHTTSRRTTDRQGGHGEGHGDQAR